MRACVRERKTESEGEQETPPAYCITLCAIVLKHMDRQVLCQYCKDMFDMVYI